jgi:hypothetical protein
MDISLKELEEALSIRRQVSKDVFPQCSELPLVYYLAKAVVGCQPLREQSSPPQQKRDGRSENVPASVTQCERKADSHQRGERDFPN